MYVYTHLHVNKTLILGPETTNTRDDRKRKIYLLDARRPTGAGWHFDHVLTGGPGSGLMQALIILFVFILPYAHIKVISTPLHPIPTFQGMMSTLY